ncbi:hypothetical protein MC885_010564 [Smutsia gigantea]|nr:hypothetical protein MC885_010564 [Smutsia gigantea]
MAISGAQAALGSGRLTIDDFMTPEEKDKLFTAIGYSESTYNLTLPKQLNSKDQGLQKTTNSSLEEIMDKAYDKFDVEINNVQLLFTRTGENWKKRRFHHPSTMHILQRLDIHVVLAKAMIEKDVRMAKFKVSGGLPLMHVRISDQKMKDVLCLINSIPLPQKSSELFPERQVSSIPVISHRTKGLLGTSLLLNGVESESDEYFGAEDGGTQTGKSMRRSELKKVAEGPNEELINLSKI